MRPWKLVLPLAALFAIGIVLAGWAKPAKANTSYVAATPLVPGVSFSISATYTNSPPGSGVTLSGAYGTFSPGVATITPPGGSISPTTPSASTLIVPGEIGGTAADTITVTTTFTCNTVGTFSITLSQAGGIPSAATSAPISCSGTGTGTGLIISPNPAAANQLVTITGTCTIGGTLSASVPSFAQSPAPVGISYATAQLANCLPSTSSFTIYYYCTTTATFTLSGSIPAYGSLTCGTGGLYGAGYGITVTPAAASIGQTVSVTSTCAYGQALTTTIGGGTFTSATINGIAAYPAGTTVSCTQAGPITASFVCSAAVPVNFTLGSYTGSLSCGGVGSPYGTPYGSPYALTISPTSAGDGQPVTVTGTCSAPGQLLSAAPVGGTFTTSTNGTVTPGGQSITCGAVGPMTATFSCTTTTSVNFSLNGQSGVVYCGGTFGATSCYGVPTAAPYASYPYTSLYSGYPQVPTVCSTPVIPQIYATPTTLVPATVAVTASPTSVSCNGTSIISVSVRDASGAAVPDNTAVVLSADVGSVSPTQATTLSGQISLVIYSAPSGSSGTANITATAGSASGKAQVSLNCSGSSTTSPVNTSFSPPPPPLSTNSILPIITPPNTGDGGLVATDHSGHWDLLAGLVVLSGAIVGAIAVIRIRI